MIYVLTHLGTQASAYVLRWTTVLCSFICIREIATWFVENVIGERLAANILRSSRSSSARELFDYAAQKNPCRELSYEELESK